MRPAERPPRCTAVPVAHARASSAAPSRERERVSVFRPCRHRVAPLRADVCAARTARRPADPSGWRRSRSRVSSPRPSVLVRAATRHRSRALQERHDGPVATFARDGEHPAMRSHARDGAGREPEQRTNSRQTRVASADAVVPLAFEVLQEAPMRASRSSKSSCAGPCHCAVARNQQQPQTVAIGGHGVPACAFLADQTLGEERLEARRERAHRFCSASCLQALCGEQQQLGS